MNINDDLKLPLDIKNAKKVNLQKKEILIKNIKKQNGNGLIFF